MALQYFNFHPANLVRGVMNRLLIVAILIAYAVPHAQAQHADLAKLKAVAQRIVRVIG
jgi:hypothetical protein